MDPIGCTTAVREVRNNWRVGLYINWVTAKRRTNPEVPVHFLSQLDRLKIGIFGGSPNGLFLYEGFYIDYNVIQ